MIKSCSIVLLAAILLAGCEPAEPPAKEPADDGNTTAPGKKPSAANPKIEPAEETVKLKDMEKRDADGNLVGLTGDGLWHQRGEKEPFTGVVAGHYKNGHMESRREYKVGVQAGTETHWYNNGQKKWEIVYKHGKMVSQRQWDGDGNEQK